LFFKRNRGSTPARRDVSQDWLASLSREKTQIFDAIVRQWECSYAMMSVALDDALTLRARAELVCARQQVSIAKDLVPRLAGMLIASCQCMADHGRHIPDLPAVEPLNVEFFRGEAAQSAASWNALLHHVLWGDRSRFFHKLRILDHTIEQLCRDFHQTSTDISEGSTVQPGASWASLEMIQYDLTTCLREAEVMLKSFIRALPSDQVAGFALDMGKPPATIRVRTRPRLARASA
jgi:hypothetical protein